MYHAMKTYWGVEVYHHAFLSSGLDGSKTPASRPRRFTPRVGAYGTRRIRSWVGPRAGLDAMVKRKIPTPAGNQTPVFQPLA